MTIVRYRVCDTCGAIDTSYEGRGNSSWLCEKHRVVAIKPCTACNRPTRPYSSDARTYPDTLSRGCTNPELLCWPCYDHKRKTGKAQQEDLPRATPEQRDAALRVLVRHNALDVAQVLGLDSRHIEHQSLEETCR